MSNRTTAVMAIAMASLLAGCASSPPVGSVATAEVWAVVSAQQWAARDGFKPAERQALRAAGVDDAAVAAGRVVKLHCAMMADGWWETLAVLPPGLSAAKGSVLRLRLQDAGDNDRLGVNLVLGPSVPPLPPGQRAYRFVPDWREQGRSTNYERVELPAGQRDRYEIVQGGYLVKCRQPDAG